MYADDIVILGISQNKIKEKAKILFKASGNMALLINKVITKYMILLRQKTQKKYLKINGYPFE